MPFSRPALADLITRNINDMLARLPGSDALLRRSNLNVLARVHAAAVHGLYGFIDFVSRQVIYDTAEADYLERWSTIWGVNRKAAAFAFGQVQFVGNNGAIVPKGAELQRADGVFYAVDADTTIAGGSALVAVTALSAGAIGNADAGSLLSLTTAVAGIESSAVAQELSSGADVENDSALRARLLDRIRQPPHGGAAFDYVTWALEVPGVTRAWVTPGEAGPGTVVVRFVRDYDADLIPDAGAVAQVQAYIEYRRPVTAQVTVAAPVAVPLDFTITVSPNTVAVKDAVASELADLIARDAQPAGTLYLSHIRAAISAAAGEQNHTLTAPATDVVSAAGQITTMGAITWA